MFAVEVRDHIMIAHSLPADLFGEKRRINCKRRAMHALRRADVLALRGRAIVRVAAVLPSERDDCQTAML